MLLSLVYAESLITVSALVLLLVGAFSGERVRAVIPLLGVLVLVVAAGLVFAISGRSETLLNGAFVTDPFVATMKILTLAGSAVCLLMSTAAAEETRSRAFEFPILILLATLGMMVMISAGDLLALYMGLELQSLALYVLAAIRRDSMRASEAGLKYFILGALSSGLMLFGLSLIYGFSGHISFIGVADVLLRSGLDTGLLFGLVFLLAGLVFKVSAAPFHMWTPDVYEGAPTSVTAFFAAAPKVAAMALLMRVTYGMFGEATREWQQVLTFVALLSMVIGAFAAIGQTNIKRLMAYSSIGHMGYALVGLAAGSQEGGSALVLYLIIYLITTLGTFACILSMRTRDGEMLETIDDLAGLSKTSPFMAFMLLLFLFSLAGIPPLAGFFGKWFVFFAALEAGLLPLVIVGVLSSVVAAFYYIRIVKVMFFDEPRKAFARTAGTLWAVMALGGVFVAVAMVVPRTSLLLVDLTVNASKVFF